VAGHAGFRRRKTGERGDFDPGVAVAAVDAQAADMMFMAKGNGLLEGHALITDKRRAIDQQGGGHQADDGAKSADNDDFCQCVAAAIKKLCHSFRS
jgi:hypothetical protein